MKPQVVGGFQLGNLSLPNLRTVQRGLLTCEFFQSKVVYSFSWTEDRECSDDRSPNEANTPGKEHSGCEMNDIHGWDLHSPSKEENTRIIRDNQRDCHLSTYSSQLKARKTEPEKPRKRNKEWTSEEEDLLRQLKDKDKLLWPQIREFFPNRTEGAIKLRYHTIHKNSAARSRVPSSRAHRRGSNVSSSPPAVLQNRKRHALDTTEPRRRSRPARARGVVERLSP
ncbi:Hypothetical protein PENO1_111700 [Penicillium occitanis (nom. inval.)]|nr:Hypothetical protein PENO1_111700 [Penicillium occitanis (nom. inval.)]PCG88225.1 hypothetical protein PENOC_111980 [Penicillium occitanis (nom. inval.)]